MQKMPSRFTQGYDRIKPPEGYIQFIMENPQYRLYDRVEWPESLDRHVNADTPAWRIRELAREVFEHGPYRKDRQGTDTWTLPQQGEPRDCEDRCILFRHLARSRLPLGLEPAMRFTLCRLNGQGHCVISFDTPTDTWVVDWGTRPILTKWINLNSATGYEWIAREAPGYWWDDLRKKNVLTLDQLWRSLP